MVVRKETRAPYKPSVLPRIDSAMSGSSSSLGHDGALTTNTVESSISKQYSLVFQMMISHRTGLNAWQCGQGAKQLNQIIPVNTESMGLTWSPSNPRRPAVYSTVQRDTIVPANAPNPADSSSCHACVCL